MTETEFLKNIEDPVTVIDSRGLFVATMPRRDLHQPVTLIWTIKNGIISSDPYHTKSLAIITPDDIDYLQRNIQLRIRSAEADIERDKKKEQEISGSIEFLNKIFYEKNRPDLIICDKCVGFSLQDGEGGITRTATTRYSLILGKKLESLAKGSWNSKKEKITRKNKKSIESDLNKLLDETRKCMTALEKDIILWNENMVKLESYRVQK